MSDFKPVVGIDLGTTFSAIAFIDEFDKPVVIPNQENKPITPSVVNFYDKDTFVVGDEAVNRMIADRDNTVSFIKRRMGEPGFKLNIHGEDYTPQKVSALILAKLKRDAEAYFQSQGLDVAVKDAVITVPAYFGMEQKGATKEAGELAGLNVLMIMNEPTAAALAFGINKLGKDQTVFVFDLGGGTFDVTILEIKGNEINMIASDGSPELGGKDWDDVLVSCCSTAFKEKYGEDPQDDSNSYQELYERVLKAKISLSKLPKALITVSHNKQRESVEVTRDLFEELSSDLVAQCKSLSERVLKQANKKWSDIDTLLLSGGSTYMPMIRNLVKAMSGKEAHTDVLPDQCVAIGAAWGAHDIAHPRGCKCCEEFFKRRREEEDKETSKVVDERDIDALNIGTVLTSSTADNLIAKDQLILPYNIGLSVLNSDGQEDVAILFRKDTKLPAECSESLSIAYDGQLSLRFELIEGIGENVADYWKIGDINAEFKLPKKKGEPCDVLFFMPQYGIMKTLFKSENEEVNIEIRLTSSRIKTVSSSRLSDDFEEIDRFLTLARTIDTFKDCHTVYDLFCIKSSSATYSEIEKNIEEFVKTYAGSNAPKFKYFGKTVLAPAERIKRVLKDHRREYNDYLRENDPRIKKIKEFFYFCTKHDGILDSTEKSHLIEEGMEIGLSNEELSNLIELWILENGIKEEAVSSDALSSKKSFDGFGAMTYYEILGVLEDAGYEQIKAAYEQEYIKYNTTRDKEKGSKRFYVITEIWDCLKDPVKRREYDAQLHSEGCTLHIDMPMLVVDRKDTYFFEDVKRGTILTEKIIIKNPIGGLLLGTIKSDVPWIELDRNSILERHEQELSVRIVTAKIDTKLNKVKGNVIIDSNGGLHVVTFEVSIKD